MFKAKQEGLQGSLGKNGKRALKRDALCSRLSKRAFREASGRTVSEL